MTVPHRHLRPLSASVFSLGAAFALAKSVGDDWLMLSLPLALLTASAFLVHRRSLGPQLLARGVWWANLALGTVLATSSSEKERMAGALLAIATGSALLLAGRKTLGEASSSAGFVPAALRSVLMLLMVLALADAQTFLLFGSVGVIEGFKTNHVEELGRIVMFLGIGLAYLAGFVGLYRLRVWGAALNVGISILVLVLVFFGHGIPNTEMAVFLSILAVLHILVAAPVAITALLGRQLPSLPPRARGILAVGVIALLMVVSAAFGLRGPDWHSIAG